MSIYPFSGPGFQYFVNIVYTDTAGCSMLLIYFQETSAGRLMDFLSICSAIAAARPTPIPVIVRGRLTSTRPPAASRSSPPPARRPPPPSPGQPTTRPRPLPTTLSSTARLSWHPEGQPPAFGGQPLTQGNLTEGWPCHQPQRGRRRLTSCPSCQLSGDPLWT